MGSEPLQDTASALRRTSKMNDFMSQPPLMEGRGGEPAGAIPDFAGMLSRCGADFSKERSLYHYRAVLPWGWWREEIGTQFRDYLSWEYTCLLYTSPSPRD